MFPPLPLSPEAQCWMRKWRAVSRDTFHQVQGCPGPYRCRLQPQLSRVNRATGRLRDGLRGAGERKSALTFLGGDTEPDPWRTEKTWGQDIRERVIWAEETARGSLEVGNVGCVSVTAGGPHIRLKQEVRLESHWGQEAMVLGQAKGSGLGRVASKEPKAWSSLRERTQPG